MLIIGERINGTKKRIREAIIARDTAFIQEEARRQAEAGAQMLDVNAGTPPEREPEDLAWLTETVQAAVDLPLCLDSPNPDALAAGLALHRGRPMVNSVTGDAARQERVFPLVRRHQALLVGLTLDESGMPSTAEPRVAVASRIIAAAEAAGIPPSDLYIDPLVLPVGADAAQGPAVLEATRRLRQEFPPVHISYGLSNVSYGLPNRSLLNQTFLAMGLAMGLDAAILDPLDRRLMATLRAAEALVNLDEFAARFIAAHRAGRLEA